MGSRDESRLWRGDAELLPAGRLLPDGGLLCLDARLDAGAAVGAPLDDAGIGAFALLVCAARDGTVGGGRGDDGVCAGAVSSVGSVSTRRARRVAGVCV